MNSLSPSPSVSHESRLTIDSESLPGVQYSIRRVSFLGRLELLQRMYRQLTRLEFLNASTSAGDQFEAAVASKQVEREYIAWGLEGVTGLMIDGAPATPELLLEKGPESLVHEILKSIQNQFSLSEQERKN